MTFDTIESFVFVPVLQKDFDFKLPPFFFALWLELNENRMASQLLFGLVLIP